MGFHVVYTLTVPGPIHSMKNVIAIDSLTKLSLIESLMNLSLIDSLMDLTLIESLTKLPLDKSGEEAIIENRRHRNKRLASC